MWNNRGKHYSILCVTVTTQVIFILFYGFLFIYCYLVLYVSNLMTSYVENFALLTIES